MLQPSGGQGEDGQDDGHPRDRQPKRGPAIHIAPAVEQGGGQQRAPGQRPHEEHRPEESEGVRDEVPRQLLVEEAQELLVHDRVPEEAGIPKDGEPVPRDGNGHHQDEPESCVERAQGRIKGPGTKIAGADLGHGDHAPREEQGEGALVE